MLRNCRRTRRSYDETFTGSFARGSSGVSLRALGQKSTLTLINGRRMAVYSFAQNLQDSFVDLNSIPLSAIERIEVLKDGASAIYGSDAIAGVVNVILRKDYRGAEATLGGGVTSHSDGQEIRLSGAVGVAIRPPTATLHARGGLLRPRARLGPDRELTASGDYRHSRAAPTFDSRFPIRELRAATGDHTVSDGTHPLPHLPGGPRNHFGGSPQCTRT